MSLAANDVDIKSINWPEKSCKFSANTVHTKCFKTDYITDKELVCHLQTYLKDLLVLDEELEDARIRLVTERDFYPRNSFISFLAARTSD